MSQAPSVLQEGVSVLRIVAAAGSLAVTALVLVLLIGALEAIIVSPVSASADTPVGRRPPPAAAYTPAAATEVA